jgi:hypothetical protein
VSGSPGRCGAGEVTAADERYAACRGARDTDGVYVLPRRVRGPRETEFKLSETKARRPLFRAGNADFFLKKNHARKREVTFTANGANHTRTEIENKVLVLLQYSVLRH